MLGGVRVLLQSPDFFKLAEEWADFFYKCTVIGENNFENDVD